MVHRNSAERVVLFLQRHWKASVHNFIETLQTACNTGSELALDWIPADVVRHLLSTFKRMAEYTPVYITIEGLLCEVGRGLRAIDPSEPFTRHYASAYGNAVRLHLSEEVHVVCIPSIASCHPSSDIHREWVPAGEFEVR